MIACIAVVGKRNELLFLETYVPERDQLRFHFVAHSALDIFDERRQRRPASSSGPNAAGEMYLGHLCPIEEFRLYGYLTSTHVKFVAVLNEGEPVREAELKSVFQALHRLYVNHLLSPFAPLTGKISSDRFAKGVERQVTLYNQSGASQPPPPPPPSSLANPLLSTRSSSLSASLSASIGAGGGGPL